MATEQGKIHGALWGFGAKEGYKHTYTNFGGEAPDPHKRLGTESYKKYMHELSALEPQGFLMETKELPAAPSAAEIEKDPTLSVYTYLRQECLRCHSSFKTMGRGINGEKYFSDQSKTTIVDLMRADKTLLPAQVDEQIPAIPNLKHDFSVMIDENGTQVQTVGNHWKLSRALYNETRAKLDSRGACLSCHKEMSNEDFAVSLMVHTAKFVGVTVDNNMHKSIVNKSILLSAWVQVLGGLFLGGGIVYLYIRRRNRENKYNVKLII